MTTVIGLHQNEWQNDHIDQYIRPKKPTADLLLNPSDGEAAAVKGASPNTLVFTRILEWDRDSFIHDQYINGDPVAAGQGWATMALARIGKMGNVVIVNNEPPCTIEALRRQAQADVAFMQTLDRDGRGLKAGIGTFSGGNLQHPDIDGGASIRAYEPAFRYAAQHGHKLVIHLYFVRPAMGGATPSGVIHNPKDLALRWTNSIFPFMRANGIPIPDTFVTEFGLDLGFARDLYGYTVTSAGVGWKAPAPWGYGDSEEGARLYAQDLIAVAKAIITAREIKGLLIYCAGDNGDDRWRSFMVDGYLLRHLATLQLPAPTTTTPPQPQPTPPPPQEPPSMTLTDRLAAALRAEFGADFEDLRGKLPQTTRRDENGNLIRYKVIDSRGFDYIAWHHSETERSRTWANIAGYHVNTNGWAGIGYHGGIRQGKVALFDSVDTERAHVYGMNHEALGWCVTGRYDTMTLDERDLDAMKRVVKVLDSVYNHQKQNVGHGQIRQDGYTACPGSDIKRVLPTLRQAVPLPPPPPVIDYAKIVWQGEDAMRAEEREGRLQNAEWIRINWVEPAIRERDKVTT